MIFAPLKFKGRATLFLTAVLLVCLPLLSQIQVKNQDKPKNGNAGQIVKLGEVLQIRESGDDFYFQAPYNVKIGPDGSIFVQDVNQLLQFDHLGRFVRNYFKSGQGPGEVSSIRDYAFQDGKVIVHCPSPNKVIWFDSEGALIEDIRIESDIFGLQLSALRDDAYVFIQSDFPRDRAVTGVFDVLFSLYTLRPLEKGLQLDKAESFPVSNYMFVGQGGGRALIPLTDFTAVWAKDASVFINHTSEYRIELFDMETGGVTLEFSREYKRVKPPADYKPYGGAIIDGKPVVPPRPKFIGDILHMFVHEDQLWVLTSTEHKDKGRLVDVFDFKGNYVDNFYLEMPKNLSPSRYRFKPMAYFEGFFYFIETAADDTYVIKKYMPLNIN